MANPLDFFDLSKKWEVPKITTPYRDVQHDRKAAPPPLEKASEEPQLEDDDGTLSTASAVSSIPAYARRYREREEATYERIRSQNVEPGDAAMSAIDTNTIISSDAASTMSKDNVVKKYMGERNVSTPKVNLPIMREKIDIINKIQSYQVTVISGQTGCGKTTQVPQFILEHGENENLPVNIIVTQPRRIAAASVARRVANENGWELGRLVGYKVGSDKEHCSPDTRLLYCTTGMFKKMIINKKSLKEWTHVILDEVHEREMDMDFVLLLCKRLLNTNSGGVKLILMSATLDVRQLEDYFTAKTPGSAGSHVVHANTPFRIQEFYLDDIRKPLGDSIAEWPTFDVAEPKLDNSCIQIAIEILNRCNVMDERMAQESKTSLHIGAVLVFLPGELEIAKVKSALKSHAERANLSWWILPLHSRIPFSSMKDIYNTRSGQRKIILATNIAESSITVPDIVYVIDFCLTKKINCNRDTNYVSLQLEWADHDSCTQRKGRAGRVKEGRLFRLVFRDFYHHEAYPKISKPEMLRAPLAKVLLDTKLLDFGPPKEILALAMCPPELLSIHTNMMALKETGCLLPTVDGKAVQDDGDLTVLGELVASLPVDIKLAKLIVFGQIFGVVEECVIIAAGLTNKSIFSIEFDNRMHGFSGKLFWADRTFSDCLAILNAYQNWIRFKKDLMYASEDQQKKWCQSRQLQLKCLRDMEQSVLEIMEQLKRNKMEPVATPNRPDRRQPGHDETLTSETDNLKLKFALFGAFYPNYFIRTYTERDHRDILRAVNGKDPMTSVTLHIPGFPQGQRKYHPVYEAQIRELFRNSGLVLDAIRVEFDGSKAIIQFERRDLNVTLMSEMGSKFESSLDQTISDVGHIGEIVSEVYVAMKLRSLSRDKLRLRVYSESAAEKLLQSMQSYRDKTNHELTSYAEIGQTVPPGPETKRSSGSIEHISSPNSFWIVMNDEALAKIEKAIEEIFEQDPGNLTRVKKLSDLKVKSVYLAPYFGDYYRARVDKVETEGSAHKISVFFIDYGNCFTIRDVQCIVELDSDIIKAHPCLVRLPGQALECSLKSVRPNPLVSQRWEEGTKKLFEEDLESFKTVEGEGDDGKIYFEIYSCIPRQGQNSLMVVRVFKTEGDGTKLYLDDEFLKRENKDGKRIAQREAESYISKADHGARSKLDTLRSMESFQSSYFGGIDRIPENVTRRMDFLGRQEKVVYADIRGPTHPLEFTVSSVHRVGSTLQSRVEPDSVNSVLLDRNPSDLHDHWLVAAEVTMNQSHSALTLRSTSFMPTKPGLGAILSMVFSPRVEMRYNRNVTKYTGCLLGLGQRERNWGRRTEIDGSKIEFVPYYADHDIELKLDVKIDNDDIEHINNIRYCISKALSRNVRGREDLPLERKLREFPAEILQRRKLIECQDRLEKEFSALFFDETRKRVKKESFKHEYHWDCLPNADQLQIPRLKDVENHIFQPITGIKFGNNDMDIVNKLENLRLLAEENVSERYFTTRELDCPLCPVDTSVKYFRSRGELVEHLTASGHEYNVEMFRKRVLKK